MILTQRSPGDSQPSWFDGDLLKKILRIEIDHPEMYVDLNLFVFQIILIWIMNKNKNLRRWLVFDDSVKIMIIHLIIEDGRRIIENRVSKPKGLERRKNYHQRERINFQTWGEEKKLEKERWKMEGALPLRERERTPLSHRSVVDEAS